MSGRTTNRHAQAESLVERLEYEPKKTALVLSAGAPNAPLIAGALHAAHKAGCEFPLIYASGGGIVIALVLVAPKGKDPLAALEGIVDKLGVEDEIYKFLPLGYKTFFKGGPFTSGFRAWFRQFKLDDSAPKTAGLAALQKRFEDWIEGPVSQGNRDKAAKYKRLYNDSIDLGTALATPTLLNPMSKGLCQPFPLIEEFVDFEALARSTSTVYIPAYNLRTHRIQQFSNHPREVEDAKTRSRVSIKPITPDAVRACLASPFIYPPVMIDGEPFIEGAYEEPYNEDEWEQKLGKEIHNLLLLDILGTRQMEEFLLREPKSLWDAYGLSILTPIVANAETTRQTLGLPPQGIPHEEVVRSVPGKVLRKANIITLNFPIPAGMRITDWSRSNLQALFRIGKEAAEQRLQWRSS